MEKAYDPKELIVKAKAKGLPLLEDGAEKLVEAVFEWLEESADLSENKIDDILKVAYPHAKALALSKVDKIDGKVEAAE